MRVNSDLSLISKELSNNANVLYTSENTLVSLNPAINIIVSNTAITTGSSVPCGTKGCCEEVCWDSYNSCIQKCDMLPPGDNSMACAADCANAYQNCKVVCAEIPTGTPIPPSSPGGMSPGSGKLFNENGPTCDPTQPLINCGPSGGGIILQP